MRKTESTEKSVPPSSPLGGAEWRRNRYVARYSVNGKRIRQEIEDATGQPRFTDQKRDYEAADVEAKIIAQVAIDLANVRLGPKPGSAWTVKSFAEYWVSGQLFEKYGEVCGLKIKKSVEDDKTRLRKYVYPYVGDRPIADVDEDEAVLWFAKAYSTAQEERNGVPLAQAMKRQIYMLTHRLFELSIMPARIRSKPNPITMALLPKKGHEPIFSYLYPDEVILLLKCTDIPVVRRMYYATGTYTGLRKASIRALKWDDVDLDRKTMLCLINKNDDRPQMFPQSDPDLPGLASLVVLLKRYREYCGWPPDSAEMLPLPKTKKKDDARVLRNDLIAAGVTRKILFKRSKQIQPLRFHDLRATFVTWAVRVHKPDAWIAQRTGHLTKAVIERYTRAAANITDLTIQPFPDISDAIPELRAANVTRFPTERVKARAAAKRS